MIKKGNRRKYLPVILWCIVVFTGIVYLKTTHADNIKGASVTSKNETAGLLLKLDFENESVERLSKKSHDKLKLKLSSGESAAVAIMYEDGEYKDRYARIIPDPTKKGNHVLQYWMKNARVEGQKKGRTKGRIQMNLANINKTAVYQRYRMYLHEDLALYRTYPKKNTWFTINEFWSGARWENHPYPFRISLNIAKWQGAGKPLLFVVSGEVSAGGKKGKGNWKSIWGEVNNEYEVPVGEWLDMEVGYKQGTNKTGRFYLSIKKASESKARTIFDITNWTYHPDSPEPVPLTHWQPLKLYTSSRIIDYVRKKGGTVQIYWDDLEIFDKWPE